MVIIKLIVVALFIISSVFYVKPENWEPFMPYGISGVFSTAALMFFAFIGFDAVASAAEETKNPGKNLPRGIIGSLIICVALYMVVSLIMTGVVPYAQFGTALDHPISLVLQVVGQDWIAGFIDVGAFIGMTTVILVMLFGQSRIMFAMSRDGLMPKSLSKLHKKYKTPYAVTWMFGIIAALLGAFIPLSDLAELVNIGTLTAFTMISAAVIILRKTKPDLKRAFHCPWVPIVPGLAIVFCVFLMFQLGSHTWIRFLIWMVIGIVVYFAYSRKHSNLN